jgi:hypothetical protein
MQNRMMAAALTVAMAFSALPGAAYAASERTSRAVVAEARGKIEANEKIGLSGTAAQDAQTRAREALSRAEDAIRKDKENRAYHEANSADALAGLAQATSELDKLTTERNQIAAQ